MSIDAGPLYDPDTYVAGVPHDLFARLRTESPVHRHDDHPEGPRYVVTPHAYVRELNRNWEAYSSTQLAVAGGQGSHRDDGRAITLLEFDPPEHTNLRRLVNRGFTPRAIRALEETANQLAVDLVEGFVANGGGDAAVELAAQLPLQVTGEMLGIPERDRNDILDWTTATIGAFDPDIVAEPADALEPFLNFGEYGQRHIARRRADPGDDVFSALVHAEYEGERLTDIELGGWWQLLVTGSTETTRNLLSGGLLLLLEHPEQAERLVADETLLDSAIEEMLRLVTPVMHHQRRVTARTEHVSGVVFEENDIVDLWMSSGNRDPEVFEDPDRFDIGRAPNDHLALGSGGPHYCLGSHLAKQEARAYFSALRPHLSRLELAGPPARLRTTHFNSLKRLPVSLR